jgi:hypothetical protein
MMKALYIAWQDSQSRQWAPVGKLTREAGVYQFVYTRGAQKMSNFRPFGRMNDLSEAYISKALFPIFANRILAKNRPEYADYLRWLGLSESEYDELEELARTGGLRDTDSLELFPCPEEKLGMTYEIFFFTRGLRYLHKENEDRASKLNIGDQLYLMQDLQNAHDPMALLLRTEDPITLVGYAPRYYSTEMSQLIKSNGPENVTVTVEQISLDAPTQYRLLCRLVSPWPVNFAPCASEEFQTLA